MNKRHTVMTKKEYIAPRLSIQEIEAEQMLATSILNSDMNDQDINLADDDYDGEFNTKQFTFEW